MIFLFYICSLIAVLTALGAVLHPNPLRGSFYLILSSLSLGILYFLLGQETIAVLQIFVFPVVISGLILFVSMLLNYRTEERSLFSKKGLLASVIAGALTLKISFLIHLWMPQKLIQQYSANSIQNFGKILISKYFLPFELLAVLFVITIVSVIAIHKKSVLSNKK
ncbi:MAG: NADH-quinone oxidoreductase subunit J [bacterium]|jgi:NADH-quinone oxidoreductase subunit J